MFPSGIYDKEARPMMADPKELYACQKEAEFNEDGRPYHFLYYTIKANYYEILHVSLFLNSFITHYRSI